MGFPTYMYRCEFVLLHFILIDLFCTSARSSESKLVLLLVLGLVGQIMSQLGYSAYWYMSMYTVLVIPGLCIVMSKVAYRQPNKIMA